ncbi:MAG: nucleotidyltransferase domain-containing protein [Halobacteriaceae archaeon]
MARETGDTFGAGQAISLSVPISDPDLFKYGATNDVLLFLTNNRYEEFTIREVAAQTETPRESVRRAVNVLVANDLVTDSPKGNHRVIQINRKRLTVPDDPILRIPQPQFHHPVRTAAERLQEAIPNVIAIVLYGSVARGEADRRSDIDLWILTDANRATAQRTANPIARELEDTRFDGARYEFHVDVETTDSIPQYTEEITDIITSGIAIHGSEEFETVKSILEIPTDTEN